MNLKMKPPKSEDWYYHQSIEIPCEWKVKKMGEVLAKIENGFPYKEDYEITKENGLPITRIETISDGFIDSEKVGYVEKVSEKRCKTMMQDDILFSHINSLKHIGKTAIYEGKPPILIHGMNLLRIIPKQNMLAFYLYHFLNFNQTRNRIKALSQRAINQVSTTTHDLKKFLYILVPPVPEQRKIASILSNLDSLIQKQEEIIEEYHDLKKGLMQQLFKKGIGHKDKPKKIKSNFNKYIEIPNDWTPTTIGKEFDFSSGSTPTRKKPEFFQGNVPWAASSDLNRSIIKDTFEKITPEAIRDTNLKIYPKGTFVIAIYGLEAAGTRGRCGILGIDATLNQACLAFHKSEKIDTTFIFQYFLYYGESIALQLAQGTKQQNLNSDLLKFSKIALPPLPEQRKIASILSNLDSLIDQENRYKEKIENIKKGLMQQLLTGHTEVKV